MARNPLVIATIGLFLFSMFPLKLPADTGKQEEKSRSGHLITVVPQYMLKSGLRVDYDRKISDNHSLQLSPVFYYRDNSDLRGEFSTSYNSLLGAGMGVFHRYYPNGNSIAQRHYIAAGGGYKYYNFTYFGNRNTGNAEFFTKLQKVHGDIIIGSVITTQSSFVFDIYTGLGLRYSWHESDAAHPRTFDFLWVNYGYSGVMMNLGIRLGFAL